MLLLFIEFDHVVNYIASFWAVRKISTIIILQIFNGGFSGENDVRFEKYQVFVLIYAGLGNVSEAMEIMVLLFVGSAVKAFPSCERLLSTVVFAGLLSATYFWKEVIETYWYLLHSDCQCVIHNKCGDISCLLLCYFHLKLMEKNQKITSKL